jgi:hypothetical protein
LPALTFARPLIISAALCSGADIEFKHIFFNTLILISWRFQTWMYISVPLVLYVGERMLRALRSNAYTVKIIKVSTGGNCNGKFMQLNYKCQSFLVCTPSATSWLPLHVDYLIFQTRRVL